MRSRENTFLSKFRLKFFMREEKHFFQENFFKVGDELFLSKFLQGRETLFFLSFVSKIFSRYIVTLLFSKFLQGREILLFSKFSPQNFLKIEETFSFSRCLQGADLGMKSWKLFWIWENESFCRQFENTKFVFCEKWKILHIWSSRPDTWGKELIGRGNLVWREFERN